MLIPDDCANNKDTNSKDKNSGNADLKTDFGGVILTTKSIIFFSFHSLMRQRSSKYPFIISNTDRADKSICIRNLFLFNSLVRLV